ncbi:DUF4275 family protein [Chengkuizengella axinellae]|uniref:DUF4275 family protein n=1 Tax=Chengkuizengella axinellae TaxID=3064388 RepID=A0ABT9J5X9_9BACL|nr:DUF4275 family protein [Chengkuizengella sp. 2205SS18-9]MDP5277028.1 DUF4275 family protein [Chengkuizengella sp. 2205SS18-9]
MNTYRERLNTIVEKLPYEGVFELLFIAEAVKNRYDFKDEMKSKGVIVNYLDSAEKLKRQWEEKFTSCISKNKKDEIYLYQYLWHVFSYELLPHEEKENAIKAFDNEKKNKCYVFYQNQNHITGFPLKLENAEKIKAEDFKGEQDLYIVDENFTWTYVQTHEQEWGLGPYFYKL